MRFLFNKGEKKRWSVENEKKNPPCKQLRCLSWQYHTVHQMSLCSVHQKKLQVLCKVHSLNLWWIILNTTSFFVRVRIIINSQKAPVSIWIIQNLKQIFFKQQSSALQWSTGLNSLYKIQDVWTTMKLESSCHLPGFQSGSVALVHNCSGTWEGLFISQGYTQLLNCGLDRNA